MVDVVYEPVLPFVVQVGEPQQVGLTRVGPVTGDVTWSFDSRHATYSEAVHVANRLGREEQLVRVVKEVR